MKSTDFGNSVGKHIVGRNEGSDKVEIPRQVKENSQREEELKGKLLRKSQILRRYLRQRLVA